jgi:hypothetical protein
MAKQRTRPSRQDEPDEIRTLRRTYGRELSILREAFPDWGDDDLLNALQEANGDSNIAATRIISGK